MMDDQRPQYPWELDPSELQQATLPEPQLRTSSPPPPPSDGGAPPAPKSSPPPEPAHEKAGPQYPWELSPEDLQKYTSAPFQPSLRQKIGAFMMGALQGGVEGAGEAVAGGLRALQGLTSKLPDMMAPPGEGGYDPFASLPQQNIPKGKPSNVLGNLAAGAESLTKEASRAVRPDPRMAGSLPAETGKMVGGFVPYLAAGIAGSLPATLGVAFSQAYDNTFQDAKAHGVSDETAHKAALLNAAASSALMTLPFHKLQEILGPKTATYLNDVLLNIGKDMVGSGLSFGLASEAGRFIDNLIAQRTYDPDRSVVDGMASSAVPSFLAGALVGGAALGIKGLQDPSSFRPEKGIAPGGREEKPEAPEEGFNNIQEPLRQSLGEDLLEQIGGLQKGEAHRIADLSPVHDLLSEIEEKQKTGRLTPQKIESLRPHLSALQDLLERRRAAAEAQGAPEQPKAEDETPPPPMSAQDLLAEIERRHQAGILPPDTLARLHGPLRDLQALIEKRQQDAINRVEPPPPQVAERLAKRQQEELERQAALRRMQMVESPPPRVLQRMREKEAAQPPTAPQPQPQPREGDLDFGAAYKPLSSYPAFWTAVRALLNGAKQYDGIVNDPNLTPFELMEAIRKQKNKRPLTANEKIANFLARHMSQDSDIFRYLHEAYNKPYAEEPNKALVSRLLYSLRKGADMSDAAYLKTLRNQFPNIKPEEEATPPARQSELNLAPAPAPEPEQEPEPPPAPESPPPGAHELEAEPAREAAQEPEPEAAPEPGAEPEPEKAPSLPPPPTFSGRFDEEETRKINDFLAAVQDLRRRGPLPPEYREALLDLARKMKAHQEAQLPPEPQPERAPEPEAAREPEPAAPEPPATGIPREVIGANGSRAVYDYVRPDELHLDPERFQYKKSDKSGWTGALEGVTKYDPNLANIVTAYRDHDGKLYVVNGHQRTLLAKRAQEQGQSGISIPVRIFDARDGYEPDYMRVLGALQNIAEGSGSAVDAARIFKALEGSKIAKEEMPPLPPQSALVQQARGLAKLGDDAFGMVVNGIVPERFAAVVGNTTSDPAVQMAIMREFAKHPPSNVEEASFMARDIAEHGVHTEGVPDLFGNVQHISISPERAKIMDGAMRILLGQKRVFKAALRGETMLSSVGNILNKEANKRELDKNEQLATFLLKNAQSRGPVSDLLSDYARQVMNGKPRAAAISEFLAKARKMLEEHGIKGPPEGGNGPQTPPEEDNGPSLPFDNSPGLFGAPPEGTASAPSSGEKNEPKEPAPARVEEKRPGGAGGAERNEETRAADPTPARRDKNKVDAGAVGTAGEGSGAARGNEPASSEKRDKPVEEAGQIAPLRHSVTIEKRKPEFAHEPQEIEPFIVDVSQFPYHPMSKLGKIDHSGLMNIFRTYTSPQESGSNIGVPKGEKIYRDSVPFTLSDEELNSLKDYIDHVVSNPWYANLKNAEPHYTLEHRKVGENNIFYIKRNPSPDNMDVYFATHTGDGENGKTVVHGRIDDIKAVSRFMGFEPISVPEIGAKNLEDIHYEGSDISKTQAAKYLSKGEKDGLIGTITSHRRKKYPRWAEGLPDWTTIFKDKSIIVPAERNYDPFKGGLLIPFLNPEQYKESIGKKLRPVLYNEKTGKSIVLPFSSDSYNEEAVYVAGKPLFRESLKKRNGFLLPKQTVDLLGLTEYGAKKPDLEYRFPFKDNYHLEVAKTLLDDVAKGKKPRFREEWFADLPSHSEEERSKGGGGTALQSEVKATQAPKPVAKEAPARVSEAQAKPEPKVAPPPGPTEANKAAQDTHPEDKAVEQIAEKAKKEYTAPAGKNFFQAFLNVAIPRLEKRSKSEFGVIFDPRSDFKVKRALLNPDSALFLSGASHGDFVVHTHNRSAVPSLEDITSAYHRALGGVVSVLPNGKEIFGFFPNRSSIDKIMMFNKLVDHYDPSEVIRKLKLEFKNDDYGRLSKIERIAFLNTLSHLGLGDVIGGTDLFNVTGKELQVARNIIRKQILSHLDENDPSDKVLADKIKASKGEGNFLFFPRGHEGERPSSQIAMEFLDKGKDVLTKGRENLPTTTKEPPILHEDVDEDGEPKLDPDSHVEKDEIKTTWSILRDAAKDLSYHMMDKVSRRSPFVTRQLLGFAKTLTDIADTVRMTIAPMSKGSVEAKNIAKATANVFAQNRYLAGLRIEYFTKNFTAAERRKIYEHAENESVARQLGQDPGVHGLNGLPVQVAHIVQDLQMEARSLYRRLRSLMTGREVDDEGIPSYVPRIVSGVGTPDAEVIRDITTLPIVISQLRDALAARVMIRNIQKAGQKVGRDNVIIGNPQLVKNPATLALHRFGYEFKTNSKHLLRRKYLTSAETEEAAKHVSPDQQPKFFTLPEHPAFWMEVPVYDKDGNKGKMMAPIYISREFEGPLMAILGGQQGPLYRALMEVKSRIMSSIMFGVGHLLVISARAIPIKPNVIRLAMEGHKARRDIVIVTQMINAGLRPIQRDYGFYDTQSVEKLQKTYPGRSWTAQILGELAALPVRLTGREKTAAEIADKVKDAMDRVGTFIHDRLLWSRVADIQMGIAIHLRDKLIKKGLDPRQARAIAADMANMLVGSLPRESMSEAARKVANVLLFSRSYTLSSLGVLKRTFMGLPSDMKAVLEKYGGKDFMLKANTMAKREAAAVVLVDTALYFLANSLLQSSLNLLSGRSDLGEEVKGYLRRLKEAFTPILHRPWNVVNPTAVLEGLNHITPLGDHEPGKEHRLLVGFDKNGTGIYVRTPFGKSAEDMIGAFINFRSMLHYKLAPYMSPLIDLYEGRDEFGNPIYDPYGKPTEQIAEALRYLALHAVMNVTPSPAIEALWNIFTGHGTITDVGKVAGQLTGFSLSHGYPGGPAMGEMHAARERSEFERHRELGEIRSLVRQGEIEKAVARLTSMGYDGRQIARILRSTEHPTISGRALKDVLLKMPADQRGRFLRDLRLVNENGQ